MQGIATDKNILVFYTNRNTKKKHDATGAFIPEAKSFAKLHGVPKEQLIGMPLVTMRKKRRRELVLDTIRDRGGAEKLDCVAFFGHGWPRGIQFGFNRKNLKDLVSVLSWKSRPDLKIILYACLAAENDVREWNHKDVGPGTDGGFADLLRDELVRQNLHRTRVDAHKTKGHTSWNPYCVRFRGESVKSKLYGAVGGSWLVQPGSELWGEWVEALRYKNSGMRYRFPFMSELEIKAELAGKDLVDFER